MMLLDICLKKFSRQFSTMFVIAGLVFTSGCDGHDPCSKVQNGQECNRDTECTEGNSCWCGWCILEECDGVLEFRDHSLEYSIRYQIDKPKGDIRYEDVRDLSVLRGRCDEYYCIVSLEGIQCLSSLQELYLYEHHGISDISPLSTLTGLEKVRLANNYIVDISPLSKSTLITELDISENEIVSVSPLTDLVNLEKLNISFNQITDVSSLEGMTVLQILDMSTNDIGNYGPLSGLGSLIELYANGASNGHGDISSLSSLTTLEILELRYNNITSLVPLNNLVLLNHLDLSSNEINDVSPLVDNQGISESDWVDIYDNPIDCFEQAANIQALRDRGVDLDTNCP